MRQILQSLKTGTVELAEVPCPRVKPGHLLIRTRRSLISAGTERMLVEFGKAGWLEKARRQPDKVKQVLDKIRTDGLFETLEAVQSKLDSPLPQGYCNAGVVLEVGAGVEGFSPGDRVVSNGPHAEVVCVPRNLCALIPPGVSEEQASFAVLGAIGLQGLRLAEPTLGESFCVIGLGLIGLLTVQLLQAQGVRVLGVDLTPARLELAEQLGAEVADLRSADVLQSAQAFTGGRGMDGVLITASTRSSEPVHQAAQMCRKRGRIVLVGVVDLALSRADFYEKELSFQVSCSYGPGRYDPAYEERGQDYPLGYVRWTEQRNFGAVLELLRSGRLDVAPLISHRFALDQAPAAYELLSQPDAGLGIVLEYPEANERSDAQVRARTVRMAPAPVTGSPLRPVVGVIGAGNYAARVLIPALQKTGARLKVVASSGGASGAHAARKFGFEEATTDTEAVLTDPEVNAVVIATRHDTHARLVCQALEAGKHVFVEKPLALREAEVGEIEAAYAAASASAPRVLMVGFNRRFAPQVQKVHALLQGYPQPKALVMMVNAGAIPADHWTQDPETGGGRIIGEGCHFIDLLRFLAAAPIVSVHTDALAGTAVPRPDTVTLSLTFADGSLGAVHYFAVGHAAFPKERLEVFCGGRILQLDNFRKLRGYGWPDFRALNLWRQDKGHAHCVAAFIEAVAAGGPGPIPFEELTEVARISLQA